MANQKHDWFLNGERRGTAPDEYDDFDAKPDSFRVDESFHNGPECKRCGRRACEHCERDIWDESCPSAAPLVLGPLDKRIVSMFGGGS